MTIAPSAFAARATLCGGEPVTVIAIRGAGVPTLPPVTPRMGLVVTCPRSRPGLSPARAAARLIDDSAVTRLATSPRLVGALETAAAPPGASGGPRQTWVV